MDNKDSKSTLSRDDRGGSSFFRSRRDRDTVSNNNDSGDRAHSRESAPREHYDSKPRYGSDKPRFGGGDRDSKPRFGGGDRDSKPRFGGGDRDSKPRFGGGDRDSKPRFGGGDRDSKPRFGGDRDSKPRFGGDDKPRFGGGDRDSKPRFGGDRDSKPRFGGDRDSKPRFGNSDREFKPRFGGDDKPRFGGGDRDSKPRFGGDRDSKPRFGSDKPRFGSSDREFKPRFGGDDKPRFGGGDRDSKPRFGSDKPRFGSSDREFKPRFGGDDKPRFGGGDRDSKPRFGGDRDSKPRFGSDKPRFGSSDREFKPRFGGDDKPRFGGGDRDTKSRFGDKPRFNGPDRPRYINDRERKSKYEEKANSAPSEMRLNRFIAMSGVCSRREADTLILAGEVTVNGTMIDVLGTKVNVSDDIRLNGERLQGEKKVYIVLNKPKDYVTTVEDPHADRTVIDLLKGEVPERIYPVGRLDRNTTGVLLLTNDGNLTKELTHPSFEKKKIYHVFLNKPCTDEDLQKLASGVELEDGEVHADEVSFVENNPTEVGIELHSGRNRIVRRMFESLGYEVVKLDRVYFAGLTKMGLRRGFWRHLTPREVSAIKSGSYE